LTASQVQYPPIKRKNKQTVHSLFWDFDAIGYIFMGLATLAAIPIFEP
jgi:hypothetical protein